jgi:hypothetical protein
VYYEERSVVITPKQRGGESLTYEI